MTREERRAVAKRIARKIFVDVDDRSGFQMDDVDETTRREMRGAWADIIVEELDKLEPQE